MKKTIVSGINLMAALAILGLGIMGGLAVKSALAQGSYSSCGPCNPWYLTKSSWSVIDGSGNPLWSFTDDGASASLTMTGSGSRVWNNGGNGRAGMSMTTTLLDLYLPNGGTARFRDGGDNTMATVHDLGTTGAISASSGRFRDQTDANDYVEVSDASDTIGFTIDGAQEFFCGNGTTGCAVVDDFLVGDSLQVGGASAAHRSTTIGSVATVEIQENPATANEGKWFIQADTDTLLFRAVNDIESASSDFITVTRTGTTVDSVALSATLVSVGSGTGTGAISGATVYRGTQAGNGGNVAANSCAPAAFSVSVPGMADDRPAFCQPTSTFDTTNCSNPAPLVSANAITPIYCNETAALRDCDGAGTTWACVGFSF